MSSQSYPLKCTNHAWERMQERVINPFFIRLAYSFGKEVDHNVKVLNLDNIPTTIVEGFKHSLKNRLEHQLPIVAVFSEDSDDHNYKLVTAYRAQEGRRVAHKHTLGTYMTKHSTFKNSYDYRHRRDR